MSASQIKKEYQCFAPAMHSWGYACHPSVRKVRAAASAEPPAFAAERLAAVIASLQGCRADAPTLGQAEKGEQYSATVLKMVLAIASEDLNGLGTASEVMTTAPSSARGFFVLAATCSKPEPVVWCPTVDSQSLGTEAKAYDAATRKAHAQACAFSRQLHVFCVTAQPKIVCRRNFRWQISATSLGQ